MKILVLYSFARLEDMLAKGNVWYVRHYEAYFDRVHVLYLHGRSGARLEQGATTLVGLGSGGALRNILLAPFRLHRFCRAVRPTAYLTADLVYSWWLSLLVWPLLAARVTLMPVCRPDIIHAASGRSLSGMPMPVEKAMVTLSLWQAARVLVADANPQFLLEWLGGTRAARGKIRVVGAGVEELPSAEFLESLREERRTPSPARAPRDGFRLIYVGRLNREKRVEDLIRMMEILRGRDVRLTVIGDGERRSALESRSVELGVEDHVRFLGAVASRDLPRRLIASDAFVSPLTGTALREAALCGLPIVAYDWDWVSGFLKHEQTALLAPPKDFRMMAAHVARLMEDGALRERLSRNGRSLAERHWLPERVGEELARAFGDDRAAV